MWKWNYPYLEVLAEQVWKMNEVFRSPDQTEVQIFGGQGRAEVRKRNFTSLEVPAEMKCGSGLTHIWKSWQNKCGRWMRSSKSWPSGNTESFGPLKVLAERVCGSWTSYRWQLRQNRSAEAELHIFGSPGRDEMRKWTYPYLEVLAEQVWKMKESFRSPGRAEVWKAEFKIFGSQGRAEVRKRNFTFLEVQQRCNAEVDLPIFGSPGKTSADDERDLRSPGRAEVWKAELQIFCSRDRAELQKQIFRPLKVLAERMCGSWTSYRWQLRQSRSAEAELHIFWSPDRDEMRKWTYQYLEVLAEQVWRWTRASEVLAKRKYGKLNFRLWQSSGSMESGTRSLAVKTERNCRSNASDF